MATVRGNQQKWDMMVNPDEMSMLKSEFTAKHYKKRKKISIPKYNS